MLGRRIGSYEIRRLIATNPGEALYLAAHIDPQAHKEAVIRIFRLQTSEARTLERFRIWMEALLTLEHPNIGRIFDGGVTEDGQPYLVSEHVEGVSIDAYCAAHRLPLSQRIRLLLQVADTLHFAHTRLVAHLNLKPANILITADGVLKLLDFGPGFLLLCPENRPQTAGGAWPTGALEYVAPELLLGKPVTVAADIYSVGVILYELLVGRWPYTCEIPTEAALTDAICQSEPQPPSQALYRSEPWTATGPNRAYLTPDEIAAERSARAAGLRRRLAGDLDAILLKCLLKNPAQRYASAAELAADLQRFLERRPVLARRLTPGYWFNRLAARHRVAFAGATAAVLLGVAALAAMLIQAGWAQRERSLAQSRFSELRQLLGDSLFEIHEAIRDLPGAGSVDEMLIEREAKYLAWLSEAVKGDARLELDQAEAYLRLGAVQSARSARNLARAKQASESYNQARRLAAALLEREPGNLRAKRCLALAQVRQGPVLARLGSFSEALSSVRAGVQALQAIAAARPGGTAIHQDLAFAYETAADLLGTAGATGLIDSAQALNHLQDAAVEWRQVLRHDPNHYRARRSLAVIRSKMGDVRRFGRDLERAAADYMEAADALAALWKETHREELRRLRASISGKLGDILFERGSVEAALERYREQLVLLEGISDLAPDDPAVLHDLAAAYLCVANAELSLGRLPSARAGARRAVELYDKLGDEAQLAAALLLSGNVLAAMKQPAEALKLTQQGLALAKKLAEQPAATPTALHAYADALLTCRPELQRNPKIALHYAEQAVKRTSGLNVPFLLTLAEAHYALGNLASAVQTLEKALALLPPAPSSLRARLQARLNQYRKDLSPATPPI